MKIVIAGGRHESDFIVKMFKMEKHKLIIINSDEKYCSYISESNKVPVYNGDPSKEYVLDEAGVQDAEILISLCDKDTDNFVICMMAKKIFNVKKCICIITNPKNVELYKTLGIDSVISSTYLLSQTIKNESALENLINTLSIENEKIVITEIELNENNMLVNKAIKDINFPSNINISCIFRNPHVLIPNGNTVINARDKLVIVSTPNEQKNIIQFIQRSKESGN